MTTMANTDPEVRARAFCREFVAAPPSRRYVLGRGEYAASIGRVLDLGGYVDDHTEMRSFLGVPVVRSTELPADAMVVVASMLRPVTAMKSLEGTGAETLDYFAFEHHSGLDIKPVTFWPEFRDDYQRHRERYDAVRARLVDDESQEVFDNLVRFRLTSDLSAAADFRYDMVNQYFEDFLELAEQGESFVDIGCYDGMTSLEFAKRAPGFTRITAFEPAPANHPVVVRNLAALGADRVTVHDCGLSDAPGTLSFSDGQGSSSRLSDEGGAQIRVVRLDDLHLTEATMIKMDIEGGEIPALHGSLDTIGRLRPRLAVSVYHRAADFWQIPELIDQAGVSYELRMRHYTEGIDETVMFFLPVDQG